MTKTDPIIAVYDVEKSSNWYQSLFGCRSLHGGKQFDILVSENNDVLICLHLWGEHQHPTMMSPSVAHGNGLILYFRTDNMQQIRKNADEAGAVIEAEIHLNTNSNRMEFSIRDPDGYYLTITDYHQYEG